MNQSEVEFFDRLAPEWDSNEIKSTPERVESILSKLPVREGQNILDLGTGTGILVPYLSRMVGESGHVSAVDLSDGMLNIARKKYSELKNVSFYRLDFEEEQIPGEYDIAFLYSVYPHLHTPKDTLEWLFKMNIRAGGCVVVAFPCDEKFINNIHHERESESDHLLPADKLAEIFELWGFRARVLANNIDEYIVIINK